MDFKFNREKLLEHFKEHTANPKLEFWLAEMERCKDPRYFFNNYWTVNGKAVDPMSQEQWDSYQNYQHGQRNDFNIPIERVNVSYSGRDNDITLRDEFGLLPKPRLLNYSVNKRCRFKNKRINGNK